MTRSMPAVLSFFLVEMAPQKVLRTCNTLSHNSDRMGQPSGIAHKEVEEEGERKGNRTYQSATSLLTYAISMCSRTIDASLSRASSLILR